MKNQLGILLLSSPAFLGSLLLTLWQNQPAQALSLDSNQDSVDAQKPTPANLPCNNQSCTGNNHLETFISLMEGNNNEQLSEQFPNLEQTSDGHLILEISEEESDAAIALFGCDCVTAINALRQMRGIPIGAQGERLLPGPTIKPCTQRNAPEIGA